MVRVLADSSMALLAETAVLDDQIVTLFLQRCP
jgi:hypothetical protein